MKGYVPIELLIFVRDFFVEYYIEKVYIPIKNNIFATERVI
jgi:hypothetical protein